MQARQCFVQMGGICRDAGITWVMRSGGVSSGQFLHFIECAYAEGEQFPGWRRDLVGRIAAISRFGKISGAAA
jgi:hypothetical protein